jgi:hypothetical protein
MQLEDLLQIAVTTDRTLSLADQFHFGVCPTQLYMENRDCEALTR